MMHCYTNLREDAKTTFKIRAAYIMILLCINIYCAVIIGLNLYRWFPIPIMVANFLSILNSILHLWDTVHHNRSCPHIDEGFFIGLFDVIPNLVVLFIVIAYIVDISMKHNIIYYEFGMMVFYSSIYGGYVIAALVGLLIGLTGCIHSTIHVVEERQVLNV